MKEALSAAGLRTCEDFLAWTRGEIVSQSRTTTTRRIELTAAGGAVACYLKTYQHDGPGRRRRLFRDKCQREVRNYALLRERCAANVPEVIAHGATRRGFRVTGSFILTREIAGAMPLDAYAERNWPCPAAARRDPVRRGLLHNAARLVSRMHAAGFFHIDLQWRNLLVSIGDDGEANLHVIDCVRGGLRQTRIGRAHGLARDLSSLYKDARQRMTVGEQLRWLKAYLGIERLGRYERALIHTILHDRRIKDTGRTQ